MEATETTTDLTFFQLLGQMFIRPIQGYTFIRDEKSRGWILIALLVLILSALVTFGVQRNIFAEIEATFILPEEDFGFEIPPPSFGFGNIFPIILSPLTRLIVWLIWAGSILVCVSLFGGRTGFGKMWQLAVWGSIPYLISLPLNIIFLFTGQSQEPLTWSVANFMTSPITQPGPNATMEEFMAFTPPATSDLIVYGLAQRLDLFIIWQLLMLIIGTATIGRLGIGKSAGIVLILWVIGTLAIVIPTAFLSGGIF